ncbi:isocitrate lyase/PEP mutase family protein [Alphaproteobacteria bacterium]|jgi:2-methylisocitrate lyase-like PEP mutase family enzyme|nr:isocitrate lyase/PEP mutase family protein [Alphaproteobacteria bacterium]
MKATAKLRALLAEDGLILAGGAHDAMTAQLVEQVGFRLCVVTGAGTSVCRGYPDIGLLSMEEMVNNARYIAEGVNIPVIVDADNGYGNALNARRTVQAFESAGVAGIHIEDQTWPKRCGHMMGKSLISKEEMVQKLLAALDARRDPNFVLIARCDAYLVNGIEDVFARGDAYIEAGADVLFCEVADNLDHTRAIADHFKDRVPLLYNHSPSPMVPILTSVEIAEMGFKLDCFYAQPLLAVAKAAKDTLQSLFETGDSKAIQAQLMPLDEAWEIGGLSKIREIEKKYAE